MRKAINLLFVLLFFLSFFIWSEVARTPLDNETVRLFFLDVGQGDAILIEKGDYQILIDGGPGDEILSELGAIMPISDRKIETVILTHPHADHLTGINLILDRYEVDKFYHSGTSYNSNAYEELTVKLLDKNIDSFIPEIGEMFVPYENAEMIFLWPGAQYLGATLQNANNSSVVSRFCYFDQCVLLTGDIEVDEQKKMFDYYFSNSADNDSSQLVASNDNYSSIESKKSAIIKSDILKIPHHGSSNGTNALLLQKVDPKTVIIQVGAENKFGHPHNQVVELLKNIEIYRTDRDGRIEFIFSQKGIIKE